MMTVGIIAFALVSSGGVSAPTATATASSSVLIAAAATNAFLITNADTVLSSNRYTGGEWGQNWQLTAPAGFGFVDASSGNANVFTVSGAGETAFVSGGSATVRVRVMEQNSRQIVGSTFPLSTVGSGTGFSVVGFSNFVAGSLGAAAVASLTNAGAVGLWDDATTNRAAESWLVGATNLPAIAWLSGESRGVLIASNVLLRASHAVSDAATVFWFRTAAGALVSATALTNANLYPDICVTLLSSSPGITPMRLAPSNWLSYAPGAASLVGFPVVGGALSNYCAGRAYGCTVSNCLVAADTVFDSARAWSGFPSSGEPVMIFARGELFCVGTWWLFDRAPVAGYYLAAINAAITNLAAARGQPTNAAAVANWSEFTSY